ncbi:energy transducer TonB [Gluconobacter cerevisiae]|uniref:Energy transducer TonB n=1 Tax=Gluconobacter cerevisiae TaxID=1379734 RepID=A0ABR9YEV5_9PROT|nr:TonB family protein [Gluconobacter cerevisiae]MBF0877200.1 energy transducer TonB [Gluconobacter cerevisiae]
MNCIAKINHAAMARTFVGWQKRQVCFAQREEVLRWSISFLVVLTSTGSVLCWIMHLSTASEAVSAPPLAAIAIDMAPEPVSTLMPPVDVPPGKQQTQSISDPAAVNPPKMTAPPSSSPNPPAPVAKMEKPHKILKKNKSSPPVRQKVPDKVLSAETTTAPPSSDAPRAQTQATPASGVSSSSPSRDRTTWQGALLGRLEKFKRYPADSMEDHQEGVPIVTFSMDRRRHVLSVTLARSSGRTLLDQEAMALPTRAQPLSIPPDTMVGDPITLTLTVPIEFYIHQSQD